MRKRTTESMWLLQRLDSVTVLLLIAVSSAAGPNDHLIWWRQDNDELCWSSIVNSRLYMHLWQKGEFQPGCRMDIRLGCLADHFAQFFFFFIFFFDMFFEAQLTLSLKNTSQTLLVSEMINFIIFLPGWITSQFGVSDFGLHLKQKPQVILYVGIFYKATACLHAVFLLFVPKHT